MSETIYIVGGTTEANLITGALREAGFEVFASVATRLGETMAATRDIATGRKDAIHMADLAGRRSAAAIIDCSHPFALEASREARRAAGLVNIPYYRYTRPAADPEALGNTILVNTWEEAVDAAPAP